MKAETADPWTGRVAMVTGAGKGIGREISLFLSQKGMAVACVSRSPEDLHLLEREASEWGGRVLCGTLDVRDYSALEAFRREIELLWGRLDVLVVNAGTDRENATVESSGVDEWQEVVDINLVGAYKTVKSALPLLKKLGFGHIIVLGSGLGHRGLPTKSAYSCSKAGLWMLTRVLAQELIEDGILVNELVPGPVKTDIGRTITRRDGLVASTFGQEWTKEPKDVLPLLEFLLHQGENGPTGQSFSLARRDLF